MKAKIKNADVELYDWQEEAIKSDENLCLRCGRQVGKSTTIGVKVAEYAKWNASKEILVIASVERQAYMIFEKIIAHLEANYPDKIKRGKDKPTKTRLRMKNGTRIRCLPTGMTGSGLRGPTIDLLVADEAARIPEAVWTAVTPMLSTTDGQIILLSTPKGRQGYFFQSWMDEDFKNFHITSEEADHVSDEFLKKERKRMTKMQYAQEYLAEFIDEICQFFPTKLVEEICCLERPESPSKKQNYAGVDAARMGEDEATIEILNLRNDELRQIENITIEKCRITRLAEKIINLNKKYNFKKIYVDSRGNGSGVFDILLEENSTRRATIPIDNAKKSLDWKDERQKRLLKEDLYNNLLRLMEQEKIKLLDDDEIKMSLKSIQVDEKEDGSMQIWGDYDHIAEGLIRAAWAKKDKSLNIYVK